MKGQKLAIITARGGSKRIPLKNIKPFRGKPIIEYSIHAALESGIFDEVMVSTDHEGIAKVAMAAGAKVPFMRSPENSDDYAGTAEVLEEVVLKYQEEGKNFDWICGIYPTAPFITSKKLKEAMNLLIEKDANSVVPIVKFSYPIQRSLRHNGQYSEMVWPENYTARSQDLEPIFHDTGQFYCLRTSALLSEKKLFTTKMVGYEIPELEVQDIDNEVDWKLAELKYEFFNQQKT